jgi:NAD(P)-dependent dehydrogenase (short-subunit alcohol dehydrogenase family)
MGLLDGKVTVVTGAGSGMGKATARIFAQEGARLVISDISGAEEQTAKEIGGDVVVRRCDVSNEAQVEALVATAVSTYGRLDSMLNVAGIGIGGMLESFEEAELDRVFSINFKGVFFGSKHAVRAMKLTGGGTIINWASLAARHRYGGLWRDKGERDPPDQDHRGRIWPGPHPRQCAMPWRHRHRRHGRCIGGEDPGQGKS